MCCIFCVFTFQTLSKAAVIKLFGCVDSMWCFFAKVILGEPVSTMDSSHPQLRSHQQNRDGNLYAVIFFKREKGMEIRPGR